MGIPLSATHASGAAAAITIAALDTSDQTVSSLGAIEIEMVAWSYDAAPTGGNLKIESPANTTKFTMDITAAGAGFITFSGSGLKGAAGQAVIVTLADGSANMKLNVLQRG